MDPASTFWSPSTFDGVFNFFFVTPRLWDILLYINGGVLRRNIEASGRCFAAGSTLFSIVGGAGGEILQFDVVRVEVLP